MELDELTTISEPDQEKDSDLQFPKSSCSPFPNKIRSKYVAGSGTVEQGLKKCAAAVCHGAVVLKNKVIGSKKGDNFKDLNFLATCEKVDEVLHELVLHDLVQDFKYTLFSVDELDETGKQFKEKRILISVFGRQNTGKSTLLNSLLRARLLPMRELAETGARVFIQHNGDTDQSTAVATVEHSRKCPVLYLEYNDRQFQHPLKGAVAIYDKLHSLNSIAHHGDQNDIPKCTLETCVDFLAGAPSEWQVNLVDTPGFGEFDSRVEALATEALKSSSVCMYITTYSDLRAQASGEYLKFMLQHDPGVFEGNRLIIVITKFDQQSESAELSDTEEEITQEDAKEQTCQFVREICPSANISHDDVLPVSGRWAYHARLLASSCPHHALHSRYQENVKKCLRVVPNPTRGQGEDLNTSLDEFEDNELSTKLEKVSGITVLEERIKTMTKSCVKIWVSKMTGDYDRYLTQAVDRMKEASNKLADDIQRDEELQKSKVDCFDVIRELRKKLQESMEVENSEVYADIAMKYPVDLELSKPQESGKEEVQKMMVSFRSQCLEKVNNRKVEFGPVQLRKDLEELLKTAEQKLEGTFNSKCAFNMIYKVLIHHVGEMREKIEQMREKAREICTHSLADHTVKTAETNEDGAQEAMRLEVSKLGDVRLAAAKTSKGKDIKLVTPQLGYIKDEVKIPPVTLSFWDKFGDHLREIFASCSSSDGGKPNEPSKYRKWNEQLDNHIKTLGRHLEEECDAYFEKIQKDAIKYFHDHYCRETRAQLKLLDEEFEENIDKQLKKMERNIHANYEKKHALNDMCTYPAALKSRLHVAAEEYLGNWRVA